MIAERFTSCYQDISGRQKMFNFNDTQKKNSLFDGNIGNGIR